MELRGLLRPRLSGHEVSRGLFQVVRAHHRASSDSGQREVAFPAYWEGWLNHMQKEHVYRDGRNSYCHLCKFSTTTALFRSRVMNAQCLSIIELLFFTCD